MIAKLELEDLKAKFKELDAPGGASYHFVVVNASHGGIRLRLVIEDQPTKVFIDLGPNQYLPSQYAITMEVSL